MKYTPEEIKRMAQAWVDAAHLSRFEAYEVASRLSIQFGCTIPEVVRRIRVLAA